MNIWGAIVKNLSYFLSKWLVTFHVFAQAAQGPRRGSGWAPAHHY